MIRVHEIKLTREHLAGLSQHQRGLFILTGHALNTIGFWLRLTKMTTNDGPHSPASALPNALANTIRAAQTPIVVRAFLGALSEAWVWFNKGDNRRVVRDEYACFLSVEAAASLKALDKLFNSGRLAAIRNGIAYHYPKPEMLEAGFRRTQDVGGWSIYPTSRHTSSSYLAAELVMSHIQVADIKGETDDTSLDADYNATMDEGIEVANNLTVMLSGLLEAMIVKHFPEIMVPKLVLDIVGSPDAQTLALPFFIEWPDKDL